MKLVTKYHILYDIYTKWKTGKQKQKVSHRLDRAGAAEGKRHCGVMVKGCEVSFGNNETILNLIVVMVVKL